MNEDIKKILVSKEQIQKRVQELGKQLTKDYAGKKVVMVVLLKGAAHFATDLRCDLLSGA
jgi:hypoxanthine-guanine phosphoribosyltransferase